MSNFFVTFYFTAVVVLSILISCFIFTTFISTFTYFWVDVLEFRGWFWAGVMLLYFWGDSGVMFLYFWGDVLVFLGWCSCISGLMFLYFWADVIVFLGWCSCTWGCLGGALLGLNCWHFLFGPLSPVPHAALRRNWILTIFLWKNIEFLESRKSAHSDSLNERKPSMLIWSCLIGLA